MVSKDKQCTCLLCSELCDDPVWVECGHSFCRSCIDKTLASPETFSCPDCKKITEKSTTDLMLQDNTKTNARAYATLTHLSCPDHEEKLKFYCKDDGSLCCIICQDSLMHAGHKFLTVVDAVMIYRAELPTVVSPLEEAFKKGSELTNQCSEKIEQLQSTISEYRQHIMSEFGTLYNFLKERKDNLLGELQKRSHGFLREMENNAHIMKDNRDAIKETVAVVKQKIAETDAISFLDNINDLIKTCQEQQRESSTNVLIDKQLCLATFRGPVQYTAWKQMKSVVPVPECEQKPVSPKDKFPEISIDPPVPVASGPAQILIIGNGYMNSAKLRAKRGPLSLNLGFNTQTCFVYWEILNKCCEGLLLRLLKFRKSGIHPDVVVFHSGNDELTYIELQKLINTVQVDFGKAAETFPDTEFILSALYPKPDWWESPVEQSYFYSFLEKCAERLHFSLLKHDELERRITSRCTTTDDSCFTVYEADLFLTTIRDALLKHIKPVSAKAEMCTSQGDHFNPGNLFDGKKKQQDPSTSRCEKILFGDIHKEVHSKDPSEKDQPSGSKEIWIVGNKFMTVTSRHTAKGDLGLNLGFEKQTCTVHWFDRCWTWFGLCSKLEQASLGLKTPDIIFFYLGNMDGEGETFKKVIKSVEDSCVSIANLFPNTEFILSTHLPRAQWRRTYKENNRKEFNSCMARCSTMHRFHLLTHDELEKQLTRRYKNRYYSTIRSSEINQFLSDVRDSLEKAIFKDYNPNVKTTEDLPSGEVSCEKVQSKGTATGPKKIWILGGSFVTAVSHRAETGPLGLNLGFDTQTCNLHWQNMSDSLFDLLPKLKEPSQGAAIPDLILFYVGSCDMGKQETNNLIWCAESCFKRIAAFYPNTKCILSTLLPNPEWEGTSAEDQLECFNSYLIGRAHQPTFHLLTHDELEEKLSARYIEGNKSPLTDAEIDLFLTSIRDALQKAMFKDHKPSEEKISCKYKELSPEGTLAEDAESEDAESEDAESELAATEPDQHSTVEKVASGTKSKEIWIVGDGFPTTARQRTRTGPLGLDLGFDTCTVWWRDLSGSWFGLYSKLKKMTISRKRSPDIILFNCGSADLKRTNLKTLNITVINCLHHVANLFPNAQFVLSTLLPRPQWLETQADFLRKAFNYYLFKRAEKPRFHLLNHNELEKKLTHRYINGDHRPPTNVETDMFLTNIRNALQKAMSEDPKPSVEKSEIPASIKSSVGKPKDIFIIGSGFSMLAKCRAHNSPLGLNLGFDTKLCSLHWLRLTETWSGLLSHLKESISCVPNVIMIHLGIKDVEYVELKNAITTVENCLSDVASFYPITEIILSTLLPSPEWRGKQRDNMESRRMEFNFCLADCSNQPRFHLLIHDELEAKLAQRYTKLTTNERPNNVVSPTQAQLDLFLVTMRDALQKIIFKDNEPIDEKCKELPSGDLSSEKVRSESAENLTACPSIGGKVGSAVTGCKEIWVVEHGFVHAARNRAMSDLLGVNLGFDQQTCNIHWWRVSSAWLGVFAKLKKMTRKAKIPDIILFNMDNSDLELTALSKLTVNVDSCFSSFSSFLPSTEFIVSTVLPKQHWRGTAMERRLIDFNSFLAKYVTKMPRFHLLSNDELEKMIADRYAKKNTGYFTNAEADLFLTNMRNALQKAMPKVDKTNVDKCDADIPSTGKRQHKNEVKSVTKQKNIWIIGDSCISRAASHAETSDFGKNLGFDDQWIVHWLKVIRWLSLLQKMHQLNPILGPPSIVYLHIGDSDLSKTHYKKLITDITYDIKRLVKHFPKTQFIFSTILPTPEWLSISAEEHRKKVNAAIEKYAKNRGFEVANNERLADMLLKKFQTDRESVSLTNEENNLFLRNIKHALEKVMLKDNKPVAKKWNPQQAVPSTRNTLSGGVPGTDSSTSTAGNIEKKASGVKHIWIVGDSFICRAAQEAYCQFYGSDLGLEEEKWTVHWIGRFDMRWETLLPELNNSLSALGAPSIMFIHVGDNDVGCVPYGTLTKTMEQDLIQISKKFTNTEFVFSTILPRAEWLTDSLEQMRQEVNTALVQYVGEMGFHVAVHEDIEDTAIPRFKNGGSSDISDSEYDLFVNGIREATEAMMLKVGSA